ncbi:MAG: hypothetical protein A3D28_05265 [Omnitrophica bacterium RIFCSPHIGHO2_02_FULL_63_14]|nr:MAG: hypothetical protein A3D28_05265 [Omnitrophica bacterium RIFCSPHIGHO2_02_FULL_63_14]
MKRLSGFTLVEMVMSVTIFSIVAAGIAGTFFSGMKLWQRANQTSAVQYDGLWALETMARDLRQSVDLPWLGFTGSAQEISFPVPSDGLLYQLTYTFDEAGKQLLRTRVLVKDLVEDKEAEGTMRKTAADADAFSLSFLHRDADTEALSWTETWKPKDGVCVAVKPRITIKGEEFAKEIYIPIAG